MARPLRIEYEGAIYHVTVRGNARQKIFQDDKDRYMLYSRLADSVEIYGVKIYQYCLMDNHFHLVVETPRANLGRFMQSVLTGYTVCYNLRHRKGGHLTQGRYGARLVAGDEYLLKLSRYVHLNPVKVNGIRDLGLKEKKAYLRGYEWSSYRSYIGKAALKEWVDYEQMYGLMKGKGRIEDQYARFVEAGMAEEDDEFLVEMSRSARSIGDEEFRKKVEERHDELLGKRKRVEDVSMREARDRLRVKDVLQVVEDEAGTTIEGFKERRRDWVWKGVASKMLVKYADMTRRDCAEWTGVGSGAVVSYQIRQADELMKKDNQFRKKIETLDRQLTELAQK